MAKIKICGITNLGDALFCIRSKIDFIGFNFYAMSPRYITAGNAKKIIQEVGQQKDTGYVGIFVNEDPGVIANTASECSLGLVQLHGDETVDYTKRLRQLLPENISIIKSVRLSGKDSFGGIEKYDCDYFLFDTYVEGLYGGTGKNIDLGLLRFYQNDKCFFISGGLSLGNIKAASAATNFAIDICSGSEKSLGIKDRQLIKKILESEGL